jgi:hypothetical protein
MHEGKNDSKRDDQRDKKSKKLYAPPTWEVEEVFVRTGLACIKTELGSGGAAGAGAVIVICGGGPIQS